MDEARLIAYNEGDNYVLYNVRTKKIVRSRNVIFNENLALKDLPNPAYDLNITGIDQPSIDQYKAQPLSDRYIPVDFLNEYDYYGTPFGNAYFTNKSLVQTIPLRFGTPPPLSIEDRDSANLFAPTSPPFKPSDPAILYENSSLSTIEDRLLNPDSFELDNEMDPIGLRDSAIRRSERIRKLS
ncbi:hypothetical protein N7530_004066 [Penicillium desertorum]|uniref:Retroviral polymerase SH3-like domain-containing protein n=1 Tax=Penicillium desertorum TaxID=1303715 RepID=A0A9W9WXR4_9EURO|nr:hypothetical protein N7530_004066 [Penicillium desertorum]